jgi:hypothetical protein
MVWVGVGSQVTPVACRLANRPGWGVACRTINGSCLLNRPGFRLLGRLLACAHSRSAAKPKRTLVVEKKPGSSRRDCCVQIPIRL